MDSDGVIDLRYLLSFLLGDCNGELTRKSGKVNGKVEGYLAIPGV